MPLGSREGFFVVEARRGDVGEQVWINRSRIGIVSKETPGGLLVYGADLGTGMPLARMRVQFVVNRSFVTVETNARRHRDVESLAAPRLRARAVGKQLRILEPVAAGAACRDDRRRSHRFGGRACRRRRARGRLRAHAFARHPAARAPEARSLRCATAPRRSQSERVPLDDAGAFTTAFDGPATGTAAATMPCLAQAGSGVGGATVHVDANAGGLSLASRPPAGRRAIRAKTFRCSCTPRRADVVVRVTVVRSPHVYLGYAGDDAPWATTRWLDESFAPIADGNATVAIPHPATNSARRTACTSKPAAQPRTRASSFRRRRRRYACSSIARSRVSASPLSFDVYASSLWTASRSPERDVTVRMAHGARSQQQQLRLDGDGHARGSFSSPDLGTNLVFACVDDGGRATDAAQVQIDPQASAAASDGTSANVQIALDRADLSRRRRGDGRRACARRARRRADHLRERARHADQRVARRPAAVRSHICERRMPPASCASARRSCATALSNGPPFRSRSPRRAGRNPRASRSQTPISRRAKRRRSRWTARRRSAARSSCASAAARRREARSFRRRRRCWRSA